MTRVFSLRARLTAIILIPLVLIASLVMPAWTVAGETDVDSAFSVIEEEGNKLLSRFAQTN